MAITIADDQNHRALLARVSGLKRRMKVGTRLVVGLQTVALVCMAVGHYVRSRGGYSGLEARGSPC